MRKLLLAMILVLPAHVAFADDAGKPVYEKLCASCHASDGKGAAAKAKALKIDPNLLNLGRPEAANVTRDKAKEALVKGKDKMPAYEKKLKPADVDPVLDYALGLAKAIRDAAK